MKITKMQGLGNDYLYFHEEVPANVSDLSILLSDRHYGVGSDGLIYITESVTADFGMRIFNADGSEALMCGNGIRCVGKYIYEKGLSDKTDLLIETRSGIRRLHLHVHDGKVTSVSVNMGAVTVSPAETVEIGGQTCTLYPVSTGNPHAVIFTDEEGLSLPEKIGSLIEHHAGGKNSPYIWMKCPCGSGSWETFDILLKQAQIVATPGAGFGESGEGWIRFSMFAKEEDVEEAGRRISRLRYEKYF